MMIVASFKQVLSLICATRVVLSKTTLFFDLWHGKHSVSHVPCCFFFETAYYHYYFLVSLLLSFYFYYLIFLSRFWVVPGGIRVGSGWFRLVPGGSGRFRQVPGGFCVLHTPQKRWEISHEALDCLLHVYIRASKWRQATRITPLHLLKKYSDNKLSKDYKKRRTRENVLGKRLARKFSLIAEAVPKTDAFFDVFSSSSQNIIENQRTSQKSSSFIDSRHFNFDLGGKKFLLPVFFTV